MKTIVVCRTTEVASGRYCIEGSGKCRHLETQMFPVAGRNQITYRCNFFGVVLYGHEPKISKCDSCRAARTSRSKQ